IACRGVYDNSPDNLNNPDPTATVHWGAQTWDEMLVGYFNIAVSRPLAQLGRAAKEDRQGPFRGVVLDRLFKQLDRNGNGAIEADEVAGRLRPVFQLLDTNRDGQLSRDEFEG